MRTVLYPATVIEVDYVQLTKQSDLGEKWVALVTMRIDSKRPYYSQVILMGSKLDKFLNATLGPSRHGRMSSNLNTTRGMKCSVTITSDGSKKSKIINFFAPSTKAAISF